MKNDFKNIIDGLLMTVILGFSAILFVGGIMALMIPLSLLSLPIMVVSADRIKNDIEGNFIKKSIFSVSRDGKITQDTLRNPFNFFKVLLVKDKYNLIISEEFKMFKQLKRTDRKGNIINYHTVSQGLTVKLLKSLQKQGIIENLTYIKEKKSNLFFEKLLLGNGKKSKNKYNMYRINFNITEKPIESYMLDLCLNDNVIKEVKDSNGGCFDNSYIRVKDDNNSRKKEIEDLKRFRDSFIFDNNNENNIEKNYK